MKDLLPLLAVLLVHALAAPASAQYLFIDANGDKGCNAADFVSGDPEVDVYLDTSRNAAGFPVVCPSGEALSMATYELIFHAVVDSHGGSVVYGSWVNAMSEFTSDLGTVQDGDELRVSSSAPSVVFLPPGMYKLGTLTVTMQACSFLTFATSNGSHPEWYTGFYSECPGGGGEYRIMLGVGPGICDDADGVTWGRIEQIYR